MCLEYVDVRGFLGRNSLEDFKKSTLLTFYKVLREWKLKEDRDYKHNQQDKVFTFYKTGSQIYYNELFYYPSDPDYNYLGSTEYTFAGIDEAQQVRKKGKNTIRTRLRYNVTPNKLVPKLLMTCNPDKGYLYTDFYKPARDNKLIEGRAFVQALATDNKYNDASYLQTLRSIDDPNMKERLLFGNWEYEDDPTRMMSYENITDLFSNIVHPTQEKYIICDAARLGKDRIVVSYWQGMVCKRISAFTKKTTDVTEKIIEEWREKYQVPISHVLVDEGGVGGGIVDHLRCKGFLGNRVAFKKENYANLRCQCFYILARKVNAHEMRIECANPEIRELIIEELEQVKTWEADKDKKLTVMPKDRVKEAIGRSPDFADTLSMRMFFEFKNTIAISFA